MITFTVFLTEPDEIIYAEATLTSAKLTHPDCRLVILTGETLKLSVDPAIEVVRFPIRKEGFDRARLHAQAEFLKMEKGGRHVVFLHSDYIVQKKLLPVFEREFDLALTYRVHPLPIHDGVMLFHKAGLRKGDLFLKKICHIFDEKYSEFNEKRGTQLSLMDHVTMAAFLTRQYDLINIEEVSLLFLPGYLYNFSSDEGVEMNNPLPDKSILHFRGNRKEQMLPYYNSVILRA